MHLGGSARQGSASTDLCTPGDERSAGPPSGPALRDSHRGDGQATRTLGDSRGRSKGNDGDQVTSASLYAIHSDLVTSEPPRSPGHLFLL